MKKLISYICVTLLAVAMLSSCGSRRGDKGCPNNFGMQFSAPSVLING